MNGRVLVWPWHGLLQGGQIKLSDDSYRPHEQPPANNYFERSVVFRFRNEAAGSISPAEQALAPVGGEFRSDVLIQSGWLYGKNLAGWIWLDDSGRRWRVRPTWNSTLGSLTSLTVTLKFNLFGQVGAEPEEFSKVLSITLTGMPTSGQLDALAGVSRTFERRITSINSTGSLAVITLAVRPSSPTVARPSQLMPYSFLVIELSGAGEEVLASIAMPYNYSELWEHSRGAGDSALYLGRHAYTEKSRVPGAEPDTEVVTSGVTRIIQSTPPGFGGNPLDAPAARFPVAGASLSHGKQLIDLLAADSGVQPLYLEIDISTEASGEFDVGPGTDRVQVWRVSTNTLLTTPQAGSPDTEYSAAATGIVTVRLSGAVTADLYEFEFSNSLTWAEGQSELHMVGSFADSSWDIYRSSPDSLWLYAINLGEAHSLTFSLTNGAAGRQDIHLVRANSVVQLACRRNYVDNIYYDQKLVTPAGVMATGAVSTSTVVSGSYYAAFNPSTQQVATADEPLSWI